MTEVFLPNNVFLSLGGLYRSPSTNKAESTRSIVDFIEKVCNRQLTYLLLVGDFNYVIWETFTVSESSSTSKPYEEILEVLSTCTLYQHVSEPTHFKPGILLYLLDLLGDSK